MREWRMVQLGDYCEVQNGYPFSSESFDEREGMPLIRVRSLKTQFCDMRIKGTYDDSYLVQNGSVLIGMDGDFQPCLWHGGDALLNQRVCKLRNFSSELDPRFAYLALKEPLRKLEEVTHYTTVKHLSSSAIKEIEIPLPPIADQRTIAHVLQTVMNAKEARQGELVLERERKTALMQYLFKFGLGGDEARTIEERTHGCSPSDWDVRLLDECAFIQTGVAKGRKLNGADLTTAPYLRVANVQNGYLDLQEMKEITIRKSEVARYRLAEGDVVLTEGGDFDKLGRGFVWRSQLAICVHQNHVFAVRPNRTVLMPDFLAYLVQSPYGRSYFLSVAHKTTNLACINKTKLGRFPVLVPKLDEQQGIANILTACDSKISALGGEIAHFQELFEALLDELLSGKHETSSSISKDNHA